MDSVSDVVLDGDGVFKYILIELTEKRKDESKPAKIKMIVRGFQWAEFHGKRTLMICAYSKGQ